MVVVAVAAVVAELSCCRVVSGRHIIVQVLETLLKKQILSMLHDVLLG